ncbi:hypothetical protein OSL57_27210, partial [Escherichia coli]|nr:hypothetical protein [Escherichia coli]
SPGCHIAAYGGELDGRFLRQGFHHLMECIGTFSQSREGVVEGVSGVSEGVYHPIQINPGIL